VSGVGQPGSSCGSCTSWGVGEAAVAVDRSRAPDVRSCAPPRGSATCCPPEPERHEGTDGREDANREEGMPLRSPGAVTFGWTTEIGQGGSSVQWAEREACGR
jgi:hypothetical protein